MLFRELEKIVGEEKQKGSLTSLIRNLLKEYLQVYVLYFIYTSPPYHKNLIFTGGTCLRHFFGLERLSEDLDLDYLEKLDSTRLAAELENFFKIHFRYAETNISVRQQGKQILIKFPVLKQLELAQSWESDWLYVKLDLSENPSSHYAVETTSKSKFGFNFVAKHYDLNTLMAGKMHVILTRSYLKGKNDEYSLKGRDYFDLLWFVKQGVIPNLARLNDLLGKQMRLGEVEILVNEKVKELVTRHRNDFQRDLVPLVRYPDFIKSYIENYADEYFRYESLSFKKID